MSLFPTQAPSPEEENPIFTVSELTGLIKNVMEETFPSVWVSGEISDLSRPQSGHCYLTLNDERAKIKGVLWRSTMARVAFDLHDGLEVICHGSLDVYAPRGTYQLVIDRVQPKGLGALELKLRQLQSKLSAEGLFDPGRKRPLPRFPRQIAVVTSPTGAAIRDFLEVMHRRWSGTGVLILPVRVQGEGSAAEIAQAIRLANRLHRPIDVLVVTRGGGSLEDLWAFNDEDVVRAIHGSRIPVISAIGHEIDVTLSDMVADVRALTPSEAAERIVPSRDEVLGLLNEARKRLKAGLTSKAIHARARLEALASRRVFRRPVERIHELARRLDELGGRFSRLMQHRLEVVRGELNSAASRLETLSPLGVLKRGYSLTTKASDGQLLRDARDAEIGDRIVSRLAQGETVSRIEEIR